jgi:hypothetical protein
MNSLEAAILRTVLYADIFDFPLTLAEVHHFLIHTEPASLYDIRRTLATSEYLRAFLESVEGYIIYNGRSTLIETRLAREQSSRRLWPNAIQYGRWLACLPFVRMVALTGALAVRNASDDDDDLDYILVTAPRRVWIARAFAILLVRLGRLRGVEICPNFVLAETAMTQTKQDVFMAHEVAQMVPLFGYDLYWRFRAANAWVKDYLANAEGPLYDEAELQPDSIRASLKRLLERALSGALGDKLEQWEYHRKRRRFAPEMQKNHSSAQLDETQVKGHFDDHGHPALQRYFRRLRECGLENQMVAVPGD